MLGYFKTTYTIQSVPVLVRCAGLLLAATLLFWLFGGFPPRPWLFLAGMLPQLPGLWSYRGSGILLPFGSLVLLCITLGIAWGLLVYIGVKMLWQGWRYLSEQRRFSVEFQEAEALASRKVEQQPPRRQRTAPGTARRPASTPSRPQMPSHPQTPSRPRIVSLPLRDAWASAGPSIADFPTQVPAPKPVLRPNFVAPAPIPVPEQVNFPTRPEQQATRPAFEPDSGSQANSAIASPEPATTQQLEDDSLLILIGSATDPGHKRRQKPNEDNLFVLQHKRQRNGQPFGLFVVADGMGGHSNGREASRLTIQAFCEVAVPAIAHSVETDEAYFTDLLMDALQHANLKLYQQNRSQEADMGTTITAALLIGNNAYILNVGDSRTYLQRPATGLTQVTEDHSVVARLVHQGAIAPEDIYTHPRRNQIYRCIGEKAAVEADMFVVSILTGDKLLLCSDGLWEMVRDPQIEQILNIQVEPALTCKYFIQAALDGGGEDNISAVVVQITHVPV